MLKLGGNGAVDGLEGPAVIGLIDLAGAMGEERLDCQDETAVQFFARFPDVGIVNLRLLVDGSADTVTTQIRNDSVTAAGSFSINFGKPRI